MATATAHQIIIPVFTGIIHDEQSQLVDARELHMFLESRQEFSTWIKNRIKQYEFAPDVDFSSFDKIIKRDKGATKTTEYHVTLDMAKELAMVERNERGRQARRYFIECEKRLRQIAPDDADTIQEMTIGTRGFQCLKGIVDGKVGRLPRENRRGAKIHLWQQVHKAFSVVSAEDIPAESMSDARNFVAAYALEGEYLAAIQDDDHITINLPKAPNDQFDNLRASRLYGEDTMHFSKLSELLSLLSEAKQSGQYVRVMDISAASVEVQALRHWVEHLATLSNGMKINLKCIQSSSERLLERWMTIFHPCIDMLDGIVAHEFRERLIAIKMASRSLNNRTNQAINMSSGELCSHIAT